MTKTIDELAVKYGAATAQDDNAAAVCVRDMLLQEVSALVGRGYGEAEATWTVAKIARRWSEMIMSDSKYADPCQRARSDRGDTSGKS